MTPGAPVSAWVPRAFPCGLMASTGVQVRRADSPGDFRHSVRTRLGGDPVAPGPNADTPFTARYNSRFHPRETAR